MFFKVFLFVRVDYQLFRKPVIHVHMKKTVMFCFDSQETFTPAKYFSIDRVFRNETLDATHLAEFHQIEGVVADYNLTLGDLIGVLYEFFKKLGICLHQW